MKNLKKTVAMLSTLGIIASSTAVYAATTKTFADSLNNSQYKRHN